MPGTDDIAREVADILFDQTVKAANMATDVVPRALHGIGAVTSVSLSQVVDMLMKNNQREQLRKLKGEISSQQMTEIVRKFSEKSSNVLVGDRDAKDYEALLKDQGVLFAKIDRQDDDCVMFTFLDKDLELVENATRILHARQGQVTELNAKLYFNSLSPDKVHVVEGLSATEMELFRHYAREQSLLFTSIPRKDGIMVVCSTDDAQKARRALLYTGWALTGANGARVREQVERRLAGRTAINIAAEEGDRELYIVSQRDPGNYIHITAEDFEVYKNSKQVATTSRKDPDFYAKCVSSCEGLNHPVVMSGDQFRSGLSQEDLQRAHTIELFPDFHEDEIQMEQANRLASLVAMKSGLDDEHNATWGLWDPSVSYSEFAAYEFIMDEDERDARVYEFEHFKDAAYYSQNHHTTYDVDMKEKNLDYIIAKAEEKQRQRSGEPAPQREPAKSGWFFGNRNDDKDDKSR